MRFKFGLLDQSPKYNLKFPGAWVTNHAIPLTLALMWAGLLWSRALLSVSMGVFFTLALFVKRPAEIWRIFRSAPFLWLMALLFLVPLASGLWSENTRDWMVILVRKLPLLLFPFSCFLLKSMKPVHDQWLTVIFNTLLLAACIWSLAAYLPDAGAYDEAYLRAQVIPVAMNNDHVRFGWALGIACLLSFELLFFSETPVHPALSRYSAFLLIFFAFFIHLLASKTGLAGFYSALFLAVVRLVRKKSKWRTAAAICLLVLPLTAWLLMPSFRNRLKFIRWDFQNHQSGMYVEGLSDAPRRLSQAAGLSIFEKYPLGGAGFGDIKQETAWWYTARADYLKDYERLALPSSEWLVYAAGAGLAGFILFTLSVFYPFFMRSHTRHYSWLAFHILAVAGFLFEIGLEIQYGIFLYGFFGCWLYARYGNRNGTTH